MKRVEMKIPCDLSEIAYEDAIHEAFEHKPRPSDNPFFCNKHLYCSIWDSNKAIKIMAKYQDFDLTIVRKYRAGEYSVKFPSLDLEVYSPGA